MLLAVIVKAFCPLPVSETDTVGLTGSLLAIEIAAEALPIAAGVNVTLIVHELPAARLTQLFVCAK